MNSYVKVWNIIVAPGVPLEAVQPPTPPASLLTPSYILICYVMLGKWLQSFQVTVSSPFKGVLAPVLEDGCQGALDHESCAWRWAIEQHNIEDTQPTQLKLDVTGERWPSVTLPYEYFKLRAVWWLLIISGFFFFRDNIGWLSSSGLLIS